MALRATEKFPDGRWCFVLDSAVLTGSDHPQIIPFKVFMSEVIIELPMFHPAQKEIQSQAKRYNTLACG